MTEITQEGPQKKGAQFGSLRRQYKKARDQSEKTLIESGISPDNKKAFERARYQFAKQLTTKEIEGEVDVLTGLLNRRGFNRRIRDEVGRMHRDKKDAFVMILDVNGLKKINDDKIKGGHEKGDEILKKTAQCITNVARPTDVVVRWGGDEFLILLTGTQDAQGANAFWNRLNPVFVKQGINISAGASKLEIEPSNIQGSIDKSIAKADGVMYLAKDQSRELKRNILATSN